MDDTHDPLPKGEFTPMTQRDLDYLGAMADVPPDHFNPWPPEEDDSEARADFWAEQWRHNGQS